MLRESVQLGRLSGKTYKYMIGQGHKGMKKWEMLPSVRKHEESYHDQGWRIDKGKDIGAG